MPIYIREKIIDICDGGTRARLKSGQMGESPKLKLGHMGERKMPNIELFLYFL